MSIHLRFSVGLAVALGAASCSAPATAPGAPGPVAPSASASALSPPSGAAGDPTAPVAQAIEVETGSTLPLDFARIRAPAVRSPSIERFDHSLWAAGGITQTMLINFVGGDRISRDPVYTFTVAEPIAKARFLSVGAETLVLGPDDFGRGGYEWESDLAAGEYRVYAKDSTISEQDQIAEIVITHIANEQALLARITAALPVLQLDPAVVNPMHDVIRTGRLFDAREAAMKPCQLGGLFAPAVTLVVPEATQSLFLGTAAPEQFVLVGEQGANCISFEEEVAAGRYVLFVREPGDNLDGAPRAVALELDVRDRALAYPPADRTVDLAAHAPATVQLFAGQVRAAAPHQATRVVRSCAPAPDAPDLFLTVERETAAALLWSGADLSLRVVGPLENKEAWYNSTGGHGGQRLWCGAEVPKLASGTYAVWVAGASGTDFQLALYDDKTTIDPFAMLVKPAAAPPLADRQLGHYYPFIDQEYRAAVAAEDRSIHPFLVVPDRLLVYAARDLDHMKQGEPGLVIEADAKRSKVRSVDGAVAYVANGELTIDRPAKVVIGLDEPEEPVIQWAINDPEPEDAAAVARYQKIYTAYSDCYDAYIEKHDQSGEWTVLRVKRDGSIVNLNNQIADRANKSCGATKAEKAGDKLLVELRKTQLARYKKRVARLEARFAATIE